VPSCASNLSPDERDDRGGSVYELPDPPSLRAELTH
jgi:hypothetical protein